MLDLQTISDRLEIEDLMTAYCRVIDRNDWEHYPQLFTEDAYVDYSGSGGNQGSVPEIIQFLREAFSMVVASQHMVSNFEVEIAGDEASVRCLLHNPMLFGTEEESVTHFFGVWYQLALRRESGAWKIRELSQELAYSAGPLP